MSNSFFQFKRFIIHQDKCAMKVTTDACLFGAWVADRINNKEPARPAGRLIINTVLDIGTGTGLLALMYAQKNPEADIDAIEIDEDAAEQVRENVEAFPRKNRIRVINADARNHSYPHKYDLIISNPPFYENELKPGSNKKNIAHHNEGLLLKELLSVIKKNLTPEGIFCLLLPYKRHIEIKRLLFQHEFDILQMVFVRQSVHHDYFRVMIIGKLKKNDPIETQFDEISIWNERQQYTPEFADLLKDYYLYL